MYSILEHDYNPNIQMLRHENSKFKASLGYLERSCLQQQK